MRPDVLVRFDIAANRVIEVTLQNRLSG